MAIQNIIPAPQPRGADKIKFTKSSWQIPYIGTATVTQSGYVSKNFGIHKQYGKWCVTHIPSGRSMSLLDANSLQDAKARVSLAEVRFDWSQGADLHEIAQHNHIDARDIVDAIREIAKAATHA